MLPAAGGVEDEASQLAAALIEVHARPPAYRASDPTAGAAWRGTWPRPCSAIRRRALSVISVAMPADCRALAAAWSTTFSSRRTSSSARPSSLPAVALLRPRVDRKSLRLHYSH